MHALPTLLLLLAAAARGGAAAVPSTPPAAPTALRREIKTADLLAGIDGKAAAAAAPAPGILRPDGARRHVAVIGAGFSGLTAANELRQMGFRVTVFEKADHVGGRAHRFTTSDGAHTFDAGPSWYWMPEIFDSVFSRYGRRTSEFYNLTRLDPAYRVVMPAPDSLAAPGTTVDVDVPGDLPSLLSWADRIDPRNTLRAFFADAKVKYDKGIWEWIWKPMVSWWELLDVGLARAGLTLNMFGSFEADLNQHTADPTLRTILKWPVIFIGASPAEAPAMYSLMTYAGHALGTWFPNNGQGMAAPAQALARVAREAGVEIRTDSEVERIVFGGPAGSRAEKICPKRSRGSGSSVGNAQDDGCVEVDAVVASADYHHVEQRLLPPRLRRYSTRFWSKEVMSPSCLLFYLGFAGERLDGLLHHTFFFDSGLDAHLRDVFVRHESTDQPTFYVTATTLTEPATSAPKEDLFVLVPVSYRLNGTDTETVRAAILAKILARMGRRVTTSSGKSLADAVTYQKSYGPSDFQRDFYAFRGNAFGLANTLDQSLVLKPSMDSLADNLVFAGHLTNPGPGVPPAMVSGIVAAKRLRERMAASDAQEASIFRSPTTRKLTAMVTNHPVWLAGGWALRALLAAAVAAHVALVVGLLVSRYVQSWATCVDLMYIHGRTYFAASTLMNGRRFLDTSAVYALCRVADDYVDTTEGTPEMRAKDLDRFQADFWTCFDQNRGEFKRHPVLPAVIEATRRLGYPRELFERFFRSMEMDAVGEHVCQTYADTIFYMEGSAAVIGDFMVPLLMNQCTPEERAKALPHARDLGNGFQLTNMIRDIGEDLDLGRQYVPQQMCSAAGVDLKLRDPSQKGFPELMERLFARADEHYASADIGIGMLPLEVRSVIKVASVLYHEIHDEIRKVNYDIFNSGRVRVKFKKKAQMASKIVSPSQIARIVLVELYFLWLRAWLPVAAPLGVILATRLATRWASCGGCSYAFFHLVWTLPCIALLGYAAYRRSDRAHLSMSLKWVAVLALVATLYTTPWDNYLVYTGVWGYAQSGGDESSVLATLGYVPVEEYAFFTLETIIVGLTWLAVVPEREKLELPPDSSKQASYHASQYVRVQHVQMNADGTIKRAVTQVSAGRLGLLALLSLCAFSAWSLTSPALSVASATKTRYLNLILVWASPVLAVQWLYGHDALLSNKRNWMLTSALSTAALSIADEWAIRGGIWTISDQFSVGTMSWIGLPDLPVEEFTFFLCTSLMCSWGLTLAMIVSAHARRLRLQGFPRQGESKKDGASVNPFIRSLWHVYNWDASPCRCYDHLCAATTTAVSFSAVARSHLKTVHTALANGFAFGALILFGCLGYAPSYALQAKFLLCTTMFLGMPHGALDPILVHAGLAGEGATFGFLSTSRPSSSSSLLQGGLARAWGPYMALMVLTWTVWAVFPGVALALFIVMSVAHFGEGDVATSDWARSDIGVAARGRFWKLRGGFLEMFARGGAFLVAVEAFPMEVRHIFIDMAGEHEVATVMGLLHNLSMCHAWATAVVGLAHLAHIHEDHSMLVAIELAVVNNLYRWCPPLVAFAIYFNFFHSLRHIMRVAEFAPETVAKRGKAVAALFTLLATLPMVAVALWNAEEFGAVGVAWIENSIKMIFIGLSVLTTPHMVLVGALHVREVTQRRARKQKLDEDVDAAELSAAEPETAWPGTLFPVGVLPSGPPSSHIVAVEVG